MIIAAWLITVVLILVFIDYEINKYFLNNKQLKEIQNMKLELQLCKDTLNILHNNINELETTVNVISNESTVVSSNISQLNDKYNKLYVSNFGLGGNKLLNRKTHE
jgi:hypothetical protein